MKEIIEEYGTYVAVFFVGTGMLIGYRQVVECLKMATLVFLEQLC